MVAVAAWEMYIELITRVTTQYVEPIHGDEKVALDSVSRLFDLTRETLRRQGRHCDEFSKIATLVLNQVVRPFTAKWHRECLEGAFEKPDRCRVLREDLTALQQKLREYTRMLADMAGVEDLTALQQVID